MLYTEPQRTNKIKEMKTTTNFNKQTNKHTTLNDKKKMKRAEKRDAEEWK